MLLLVANNSFGGFNKVSLLNHAWKLYKIILLKLQALKLIQCLSDD